MFTLPAELRELFGAERGVLCGRLMRTAADTLLELGSDERSLGAQLGISGVLRTWSRDLSWHPHVHCVVTGGGLRDDGTSALAIVATGLLAFIGAAAMIVAWARLLE